MHKQLASTTILSLLGVSIVAWLTSSFLPVLGLASCALLFLLPVLFAAARGGIVPGLLAALAGALAYNFFLLPPRFTLRIHGLDNVISLLVLVAVAWVTSTLATRLRVREAEARERAARSEEAAELSARLAHALPEGGLQTGLEFLTERYGLVRFMDAGAAPADDGSFSSIDHSAAAWALHNGDVTGHGTAIMPAASWTFFPLSVAPLAGRRLAALAQPLDATTRSEAELDHLRQLFLLVGQYADRNALEDERRQRERLEERDALRRTLLASLAHDLRTPLTVLTGQLAVHASDHPELADARSAAARLDHLLHDLLGAARLESGALEPALESIDLVDSIDAACTAVPSPSGISIVRDLPADLPFVRTDAVLLHHILINLLDNAFRHARSQVTLQAQAQADRVVLSCADDGPGIVLADRDRIFQRFERIEGGDRVGGSGLGLAIVKGFADAMDMSIAVDAAPGGGARFTLGLPIAAEVRA